MVKLFRSCCLDTSHSSDFSGKELGMGLGPNWGSDDVSSTRVTSTQSKKPAAKLEVKKPPVTDAGNPDPQNFNIMQSEKVGRFVILLVQYPDCKNYEGDKVLVFEGVALETLKRLSSLDPHFCNSRAHLSPVARFVPTIQGWLYATKFCKSA
jgi:hypothetical protein